MKRPFVWIAIFLILGIISGQYMEFFPCTAILLCFISIYKIVKNKIYVFILPLSIFFVSTILSFGVSDKVIFERNESVLIKCNVLSAEFTKTNRQKLWCVCNEKFENNQKNKCNFKVLVYTPKDTFVDIGDDIIVEGKAADMRKPSTKGGFDMGKYVLSKGYDTAVYAENIYFIKHNPNILKFILDFRKTIKNVYYNVFPQKEAAIISAMVIGDGSDIDDNTRQIYSSSGIAHILAVSGLHTAVMCSAALIIFKKFMSKRNAFIAASIFVAFYVIFAGGRPSVVRAALMMEIVIIGHIIYRQPDIINSLCVAISIMVMSNFNIIYDTGFLLSVASVYGCIKCTQIIEDETTIFKKFISVMTTSFMVSVFTLPIMTNSFYNVSFAGIFSNILVIPLLMPLLVLALLCGLFGILNINLGIFFGGSVYVILKFFEAIGKVISSLPLVNIHTGNLGLIFAFLYYILIIILMYDGLKGNKKAILICIDAVFIFLTILGNRFIFHKNYIDFIDVGQGDSIILRTYDGGVYIFDTGGYITEGDNTGANIILPYLDYYGKDSVDALFISHPDNDHCGGAVEIMEGIDVRKLFIADYEYEENDLYKEILNCAENVGTDIEYIKAGYSANALGKCSFQCLYPLEKSISDENTNNGGSLVIKIVCGETSILLTGDIGIFDEKFLCYVNSPLECNILKVAHHGSKYSTSNEFLDKLNAEYAIISYGENNRYGHPADIVKQNLESHNIKIYETAVLGSITAETDGKKLNISTVYQEE